MIEYKSGERLGFIKKAHTRKSVLVQLKSEKPLESLFKSFGLRLKDSIGPFERRA